MPNEDLQLTDYGWSDRWARKFADVAIPSGQPGRVIAEHRERYVVHVAEGDIGARVAGRMRHAALERSDFPAVGDWVVVTVDHRDAVLIHAVLPRHSTFSRRTAGSRADEQIIAANVDTVWVVSALNGDVNPARIERYLTMVWESGARPVVVLTKADLVQEPHAVVNALRSSLVGVPVQAVSGVDGSGLDDLASYISRGQTIALVGSSGVGKSTLANHFAGQDLMAVKAVRTYDGKGRHTTTHRALIPLPAGGLLLDTPGMRELQLWFPTEGVDATFDDIIALAGSCRFRNCEHATEPGCAVRAAIDSGTLSQARLTSYQKLKREIAHEIRKADPRAASDEKRNIRKIMRAYRKGLEWKE